MLTSTQKGSKETPANIVLNDLESGESYLYRIRFKGLEMQEWYVSEVNQFHMPREISNCHQTSKDQSLKKL